MPQETRKAVEEKACERLAETLKKVRAEVAAHVEVGEGETSPPRVIRYVVGDLLDLIDAQLEALTSDLDEDIDNAVDDMGG